MNIVPYSNIVLYSTGCPKCEVLKKKLDQNAIPYTICKDTELMKQLGFEEVPILRVGNKCSMAGNYFETFRDMNFTEAVQWINEQ